MEEEGRGNSSAGRLVVLHQDIKTQERGSGRERGRARLAASWGQVAGVAGGEENETSRLGWTALHLRPALLLMPWFRSCVSPSSSSPCLCFLHLLLVPVPFTFFSFSLSSLLLFLLLLLFFLLLRLLPRAPFFFLLGLLGRGALGTVADGLPRESQASGWLAEGRRGPLSEPSKCEPALQPGWRWRPAERCSTRQKK